MVATCRLTVSSAEERGKLRYANSVTLKNARSATQGTCPICGSKIFRIGKESPPEGPEFKITELGINPLVVNETRAIVIDCRMIID